MELDAYLTALGFEELGADETTRYLYRSKAPYFSLDYTDPDHYEFSCPSLSSAAIEEQRLLTPSLRTLIAWALLECNVDREEQKADDATEATGFDSGEEDGPPDFDYRRYIPNEPPDPSYAPTIYVWGKALRDTLSASCRIGRNYNAAILHGKKAGVDWSQCGAEVEIRRAVMRSPGFKELLEFVLSDLKRHRYDAIGINCRKGRHRSSTLAHVLKYAYFPQAKLVFKEQRSKECKRWEW